MGLILEEGKIYRIKSKEDILKYRPNNISIDDALAYGFIINGTEYFNYKMFSYCGTILDNRAIISTIGIMSIYTMNWIWYNWCLEEVLDDKNSTIMLLQRINSEKTCR